MTRFAFALGLAALVLAQPGHAEPVSTKVSLRGLDLSTSAGRAMLDQRIMGAARQLCESTGRRPLAETLDARRCRAAALDSAYIRLAGLDRAKARKG